MQVVFHAGAHMTDEDKLLACLSGNAELLGQFGAMAPPPRSYRKLMRDMLRDANQAGGAPAPDARATLLAAMGADPPPDRLILSSEGFFGTPKMAASSGVLYQAAEHRLDIYQRMFRGDGFELFLAIRNPASFLPGVFRQTRFDDFADFLGGTEPAAIRWSEMIGRLRATFPDMPITVWCYEDIPLIWAQLVREMAGFEPTTRFDGEHAILSEIMTAPGLERFEAYLASHPDMTEIQKRRVIVAFLDKFAEENAMEEELDVPGWTEAMVEDLTEIYDEDVYAIARLPGVTMITP